jgi:transposase-like protein
LCAPVAEDEEREMTRNKVDLARWKPHLEAAKREGKTIAEYARGQGLSRHTLYAARQLLRATGGLGERRQGRKRRRMPPPVPSAFAEVRLPSLLALPSGTRLEAQLANGAKLALESSEPARELLLAALTALSRRR